MRIKNTGKVKISKGKIYYKIVEWKGGEDYRLLHYGIDREKRIPLNRWLEAEIKENVRDGSGDRRYTSGIHIFDDENSARQYSGKFKDEVGGKRRITTVVKCYAEGVKKKEHSKSNVYLADRIKVIK